MKEEALLAFLLTTCVCCIFSGKGDIVNKKELTGRFVFQANNQDTIDVNSDGTYSNYRWWQGKRLKNSGTWIYDSLNSRVNFKGFSFLTDIIDIADSTFVSQGNWNTRVESMNNEIRLIYASDISKGYFLRVDTVDRRMD